MNYFIKGLFIGLIIGWGILIYNNYKLNEQLHDTQIELNICNSAFDLFESDMQRFCAIEFEKMGC